MQLPNFVVIGAQKCGTTSLFHYLKQHPSVYLPQYKELHYFSYEYLKELVTGPGDRYILASACPSRQEYETHYKSVSSQRAVGDISPSYLYFAEVSERMKNELGKPKIIVLIRNPIAKAYSQYMHLVRDNREHLDFYAGLMAEEQRRREGWAVLWRYAESSLYAEKIEKYMTVFSKDQIQVILFEELARSPHVVLRDLFQFLGVDADFQPDISRVYNKSGRPRSRIMANILAKPNIIRTAAKKFIPESIRNPITLALSNMNTGHKGEIDHPSCAYLREYFCHDVNRLEKLLGKELNWLR